MKEWSVCRGGWLERLSISVSSCTNCNISLAIHILYNIYSDIHNVYLILQQMSYLNIKSNKCQRLGTMPWNVINCWWTIGMESLLNLHSWVKHKHNNGTFIFIIYIHIISHTTNIYICIYAYICSIICYMNINKGTIYRQFSALHYTH